MLSDRYPQSHLHLHCPDQIEEWPKHHHAIVIRDTYRRYKRSVFTI